MASSEWQEIYRSYTSDELAAAITALKEQESLFSAQQVGSKSYTKDLRELRDKLHAAVRVQNERSLSPAHKNYGTTNFGGLSF